MAADPAISERIYLELRRRLLAGGFRLRERLDVGRIAADMQASATPVREALTRLATEGLIAAKPARGFFAMLWSERELATLYEWRGALVRLALEERAHAPLSIELTGDYPNDVRSVFAALEAEANRELRRAGANADDRLHAARRVEPETLGASMEDLSMIASAGTKRELLNLLRRYHARRVGAAGAIRERAVLRALPPNGE
jgi:DNA-binding GntR family transcriptional regulator